MRSERFDFPNARGQTLAALLERPAGAPATFALFAHCFTCGKDNLAAKRIAQTLAEHGIAVLRFDFTGLGASEGEFANTNFSSNVDDLVAAADHLRRTERAPALLIGHLARPGRRRAGRGRPVATRRRGRSRPSRRHPIRAT